MKHKQILLVNVLVIIFLVVPTVEAIFDPIEYHNVHPDKKYNSKYGLYKIDTPFWGNDIADIELINNTDTCLIDCYADLRVYLYKDISSDKKSFDISFTNELTSKAKFEDYDLFIRTEKINYFKKSICTNWKQTTETNYTTKNPTEQQVTKCTNSEIKTFNNTYYEYEEISFNDLSKLPVEVDNYLRITGHKGATENLDWKLTFYGYELSNWAWWNSSLDYCRNLTLNESVADSDFVYMVNLTNRSNMDDSTLRIVNGSCDYATADEVPYWIRKNTSDYIEVHFKSDGNANVNYAVYYNSSGAGITSKSNGSAVFPFFDGGEKFNNGDDIVTVGGWHDSYTGCNGKEIQEYVTHSNATFTGDTGIEMFCGKTSDDNIKTYVNPLNGDGDFIIEADIKPSLNDTTNNHGAVGVDNAQNYNQPSVSHSGRGNVNWGTRDSDITHSNTKVVADTWHKMKIICFSDLEGKVYIDNSELNINISNRCNDNYILLWTEGDTERTYYDNVRVRDYLSTLDPTVTIGNQESGGGAPAVTLIPYIDNISAIEYRGETLPNPRLEVNATNAFNWTLQLYNINGSNYTQAGSSELAGDWHNSTINLNSTLYSDASYYFNLTVIDSAANEDFNISPTFTINNLKVKLNNITGTVYTQSNNIINPHINIYSYYTASADLILYNSSNSWNIASIGSLQGNYTNNSITYDVSAFNESDNYYIILNVTDSKSNSESNTTSNFTIDTQAPVITFDWNVATGWYDDLLHDTSFKANDKTDTNRVNCTVNGNGNDITNTWLWYDDGGSYTTTNAAFQLEETITRINGSYIESINCTMEGYDSGGDTGDAVVYYKFYFRNGTTTDTATQTESVDAPNQWHTFASPSKNSKIEKINVYLKYDGDIGGNAKVGNIEYNHTGFVEANNYDFPVQLQDGINTFNATCFDSRGNSRDYTADSINIEYSQLSIYNEDNRSTTFPIENYSARMIVTPTSNDSLSYETTNSSLMTGSYFIIMNDSINSVRLAIGTNYYRGLTDYQDLANAILYMYNHTSQTSSQILFQVETIGYDKPIVVKRPRNITEDIITAEYPIGDNQEVNAYLLDSRLYNVYAYDDSDHLILIDSLMISGARTIPITIPNIGNVFLYTKDNHAHLWSNLTNGDDNYTIYARGYDDSGLLFTINLYNSSDDLLATGSFTELGTLTYGPINITNLNNTFYYANFVYSDETIQRNIIISRGSVLFPNLEFFSMGTDGEVTIALIILVISIMIAGAFTVYMSEIGLIIGGAIAIMLQMFIGAATIIYLFGLLMVIIGGGLAIAKRRY